MLSLDIGALMVGKFLGSNPQDESLPVVKAEKCNQLPLPPNSILLCP